MGTAYGHIALGVPDVAGACDRIRAAGGNITREPGPVQGGSTVIAFVTDPDGYKIELIQTRQRPSVVPAPARAPTSPDPEWPGCGGVA